MIGEDVEGVALHKMPEVLDGEIDAQQLAIECAVSCFRWLECLREVSG